MLNRNLASKIFLLPVLFLSLAACSMFEGRESGGQYVDDSTITAKVKEAYVADSQVSAMQVNVETMQGVVQLSGFVTNKTAEQRAVQLAQQVKGVKSVKDNIIVKPGSKSNSSSD
jgi:hyperosmotically inducible protein